LAVQIHGCSREAAAWIQPHCSNHTGRVRVVKTQHALKGVPLEKKIKIDTDKDKYDVKEVVDLQKGKNMFKYLVK